MNIIICVDNNYGMLFNGRRQSRDSAVLDDIFATFGESRIYISSFSEKLFEGRDVICTDDFLSVAGEDDYCFVEDADVEQIIENVGRIVIYRWNRDYPADTCFDSGILCGYCPDEPVSFAGTSHEKIDRVIYSK